RLLFALGLSILMVIHTRRKKSLTIDGAVGAFFLGMITFSSTYFFFTVVLLSFFLSSSKLTKFKADRKKLIEIDYEKSSERDLTQVVCNGLLGGIAVGLFHYLGEPTTTCYDQSKLHTVMMWIYIGHYGCCAGDTWASELGVLNKGWPTLITTFKKVPPGTNGGVSPLGLAASIGGGAFIGLMGAICLAFESPCHGFAWDIIVLGSCAGLGGSLIDSVLGATVQQTLYSSKKKMVLNEASKEDGDVISGHDILDNHQVNFLSSLLTSSACGAVAYYL
ncbi:hypothetical protein PHYBLDRAFT_91853, partial [Phycomyces blakesleeanus NRRL 1555(-)]